mgnify:CR=1 FL=1
MIILGIDPGYAIVGYGVVDYRNNHFNVVDYGAILTDAKTPFNERLEIIYDRLCQLISLHKPEAMSVEKVFYNSNAKTVIDVSQARGVIMLAAQKSRVPVFEYTPLQVKQSVVGYGSFVKAYAKLLSVPRKGGELPFPSGKESSSVSDAVQIKNRFRLWSRPFLILKRFRSLMTPPMLLQWQSVTDIQAARCRLTEI